MTDTGEMRRDGISDRFLRAFSIGMMLGIVCCLSAAPAAPAQDANPYYNYKKNPYNAANKYDPGNPYNPAARYNPDNPLNPANLYDPRNPFGTVNRYDPGNPFNPANLYNPQSPLSPANLYNPYIPLKPLP